MINILIVSSDKDALSGFTSTIEKHDDINMSWAESGGKALDMVPVNAFDLVVTDETLKDMTGLEFARSLVAANPLVNCSAVSRLSPKAFHEASEGLGLLMQLPPGPGKEHAEKLMQHLRSVLSLTVGRTG